MSPSNPVIPAGDAGSVNVGSTIVVPDTSSSAATIEPPVVIDPAAAAKTAEPVPTDAKPVPIPAEPKPVEATPAPAPAAEAAPKEAAPVPAKTDAPAKPDTPATKKDADISLFDGKTLKGWKKSDFGGEGDIEVEDGVLVLGEGADLTGVHTDRKLPRVNYEVELDAQRIDGSDFFVGFTFPVREKYCSLILGGWGGGVCGLSSIDGYDASENPTTSYQEFKKGQWYHVRLRVTADKIEAWLDKQKLVDQTITKRELSIRFEVEPSRPLGFASYQTIAGLKNIKFRKVDKPDTPPEKE